MPTVRTLEPGAARHLEDLAAIEALAEDVLTSKQQIVDLDRKRNSNRESLGLFRRNELPAGKVWMSLGTLFVKLPQEKARQLIEKDQEQISVEIEDLRETIKEKTVALNQLEDKKNVYGAPTRGFHLKAMSREDMSLVKEDE